MSKGGRTPWILLAVGIVVGIIAGLAIAPKPQPAEPVQSDADVFVSRILDHVWQATWGGSVPPAPDVSEEAGRCWQVPSFDLVADGQPVHAWRCQDADELVWWEWRVQVETGD